MKKSNNKSLPWIMLFSRIVLFFSLQGIVALIFYFSDKAKAWEYSANWWPFVVTITNIICIYLLIFLFKKDNKSYFKIFKINKDNIKADLLSMLGILIIAAPISFLPNIILSKFLFGNMETSLNLLVRPLPYIAVFISIVVFPVTQGLAEIPTYFSYVMPKFKEGGMSNWLALGLPVIMLGLQHIAVPFLFDFNFIIWRGLMYLPFALLVGIVMKWRPRLLPYLAIVHVLMDISAGAMLLNVAY